MGVLWYIFDDLSRIRGAPPKIDILCGTSVGAINACYLAAHLTDPVLGMRRLVHLWSELQITRVLGFSMLTNWLGYLLIAATVAARGELARAATVALALVAFGFGAYLLYVQVAVIDAVCDWCVASDLVITAITVLALLRFRAGYRPALA